MYHLTQGGRTEGRHLSQRLPIFFSSPTHLCLASVLSFCSFSMLLTTLGPVMSTGFGGSTTEACFTINWMSSSSSTCVLFPERGGAGLVGVARGGWRRRNLGAWYFFRGNYSTGGCSLFVFLATTCIYSVVLLNGGATCSESSVCDSHPTLIFTTCATASVILCESVTRQHHTPRAFQHCTAVRTSMAVASSRLW